MPDVAPSLGARLAASIARALSPIAASSLPRRSGTTAAAAARETKSSRAGPLIAFEHLRRPVWTPRDYTTFANEGFMQNAIVYRCVRMIAECAAHIPLLLYDGDQEIEGHALSALLRRPNPHQTWPDFMQTLVGHLLVAGNVYAEAVALDGEVRELHLLRPDRVRIVPGADGWPEAFDYSVAGRTVRLSGEVAVGVPTVLHIKLFHPSSDHYGFSPLEAAASAIDLHNTASNWNKALLDNSARPSGAIVYTARDGNLTSEQIERLKSELEAGFQGSANAGRPLLLEGGLDWKAMSLSPKDMDFIEARHVAAREIALALGVPPMLLGIPGDNTYSNLAEAQRTFWRSTVLPLVERVASELSLWLGPAFRDPVELRVDIDTLPALAGEREALWASLEKTSFLTTAEKRSLAGFSPMPGADAKWASEAPASEKFNPGQPRIPGGQPGGGQWTDGEGEGDGDASVVLVAKKPGGIAKELWKLTVRQFVSQYCKGSIREVMPGEFDDLSIADVMDLAKGGDKRARTCKKLLERQRFRKD
ncbi:MAG: phage portal protein [Hyphomicrobiaceae bacterium]|nr:phage portal protein [Hyphomicrobiaceae bacterium]